MEIKSKKIKERKREKKEDSRIPRAESTGQHVCVLSSFFAIGSAKNK